jgi:uridine kinase
MRRAVVERLANLIDGATLDHPVRVAIDGLDAAGKTVLADELAASFTARGRPVIRASVDAFHRPRAERHAREDPAEAYYRDSFDYARLRTQLLEPLGPGGNREYRRVAFDYRTDADVVSDVEVASCDAVLLFDGVFLLRRELLDCWDAKVFVSVSFDEALRRACIRDRELFGSQAEVESRYRRRYIPGQKLYLAEADPLRTADVVVENDDPARPTLASYGRR